MSVRSRSEFWVRFRIAWVVSSLGFGAALSSFAMILPRGDTPLDARLALFCLCFGFLLAQVAALPVSALAAWIGGAFRRTRYSATGSPFRRRLAYLLGVVLLVALLTAIVGLWQSD